MIVVYCHLINKGDRFTLHRLFNGLNNAFFDALRAVFYVSHNRSFKLQFENHTLTEYLLRFVLCSSLPKRSGKKATNFGKSISGLDFDGARY